MELLLEKGAYIGAKNRDNDTPLHLAIRGGHTDIVQLLDDCSLSFETSGKSHAFKDNSIEEISDALVSVTQPSLLANIPKESILIERPNEVIPLNNLKDTLTGGNGYSTTVTPWTPLTKGVSLVMRVIDLDDMISQLLAAAKQVFSSQPSSLELSPPVKILEDIHGQYTECLRCVDSHRLLTTCFLVIMLIEGNKDWR